MLGGEATSSGINYQARVIAFVYAHILVKCALDGAALSTTPPSHSPVRPAALETMRGLSLDPGFPRLKSKPNMG